MSTAVLPLSFVLSLLLLSPSGIEGDVSSASMSACKTDMDCSLNGDCVRTTAATASGCVCDPAWSASAQCDVLRFLPWDPEQNVYRNRSGASWGGNVIVPKSSGEANEGPERVHEGPEEEESFLLFAAQMVNECPLEDWGSNSEVVVASSRSMGGPYRFRSVVRAPFAHNPRIVELPRGEGYLLYIIGGSASKPKHCQGDAAGAGARKGAGDDALPGRKRGATDVAKVTGKNDSTQGLLEGSIRVLHAPSLAGPWRLYPVQFVANGTGAQYFDGHFTNPAPHIAPDGTVTLAFQGGPPHRSKELVGVARATSWKGPFEIITPLPVFPDHFYCVAGSAEDPFLWRSRRGWHIIAHGMCPTGVFQAHYAFSTDAVHWQVSPRQTYSYTVDEIGGHAHTFARVERPALFFAEHNATDGTFSQPRYLINGVCDGLRCIEGAPGMTYTMFRQLLF